MEAQAELVLFSFLHYNLAENLHGTDSSQMLILGQPQQRKVTNNTRDRKTSGEINTQIILKRREIRTVVHYASAHKRSN